MNVQLAFRVRQAILAEPEHVYMNRMLSHADTVSVDHDEPKYICDTVGCIAGHTVAIWNRLNLEKAFVKYKSGYNSLISDDHRIENEAVKALEISHATASRLFYPWGNDNPYADDFKVVEALYSPGTTMYAKGVAALIDKAVERNASEEEKVEYSALIATED